MLLKNPQTRFEEIYQIYKESFPNIGHYGDMQGKRIWKAVGSIGYGRNGKASVFRNRTNHREGPHDQKQGSIL